VAVRPWGPTPDQRPRLSGASPRPRRPASIPGEPRSSVPAPLALRHVVRCNAERAANPSVPRALAAALDGNCGVVDIYVTKLLFRTIQVQLRHSSHRIRRPAPKAERQCSTGEGGSCPTHRRRPYHRLQSASVVQSAHMTELSALSHGRWSFTALVLLAIAGCGSRTGLLPSTTGSGASSGTSTVISSGVTSGAMSGASSGYVSSGGTGMTSGFSTGTSGSGSASGPSPCGTEASPAAVSFANQLMPIFQSNCSVGGTGPTALCHGDPSVAMAMEPSGTRQWFGPPAPATNTAATLMMIYNGLVGVPSFEDPSIDTVSPGDPTKSFLWYKVNNTQGALDNENPDPCARGDLGTCGLSMPFSLTGPALVTLLPPADLGLICNWIVQGAKGSLCPVGQGYQNGNCAPCPSGETLCGDLCVNEQTDTNSCGGCGAACPTGGTCQSGACVCPKGETACGHACVSEQTDSSNCGACGTFCPIAATCQGGTCVCPSEQTWCGAYCYDEQTDLANCGACGTVCPPAATCQGGTCVCPSGQTWCGAYCVDEQVDSANCGGCGEQCPVSAPTCVTAKCTCPKGTSCGGICVDDQMDTNNCGQCGAVCPSGLVCLSGACGNPPSCAPGGPGMTNCGPGGSGAESCCASLEVTGGTTYARTYESSADGGAFLLSAPATVSSYRLDKYLVTVGRFRQFVNSVLPPNGGTGWLPAKGSGKHTHLNGGEGLVDVGAPSEAGPVYESGWVMSDDGNIAPTNTNLASCSPYSTWTNSVGSQENLPVNCVNWYEAYAFCIWDGGFLPSEAEWEYAAAGGSQQREYPWGSTPSGNSVGYQYAIYGSADPGGDGWTGCSNYPGGSCKTSGNLTDIAPVGTAALGAGLWGHLDMAGDVFEWTMDIYNGYVTPCSDCALLTLRVESGGGVGDERVVRGGDFGLSLQFLLPPVRFYTGGRSVLVGDTGFRCARAP
jgi:formylglycine-generating enzyme required for sulfatase activity